jgi:gliding motility-associated protein GldM
MAGGKETPRQKMIGMMYLVLTALLALNVSKEIINAFVKLDQKLMESNSLIINQSDGIMAEFESALLLKENKPTVRPVYDVALKVRKLTYETDRYINIDCKNELIKAVEASDWVEADEKNMRFITRNPMEIETKDDYDAATRLFGGEEGTEGFAKGEEIRNKIHQYRDDLLKLISVTEKNGKSYKFDPSKIDDTDSASIAASLEKELKNGVHKDERDKIRAIYKLLTLPENLKDNEEIVPWQLGMFDHAPVVAASAMFTAISNDIRNAEMKALELLRGRVNPEFIKVNKIDILANARTNYINLGDSLDLNVMLAAYDTTDIPLVKYGIDKDTANEANWKEIRGKINLDGMTPGEHRVKGVIGIKEKGILKWKPWSFAYEVGKPVAAFENIEMNVLYVDYDNKIRATASGYSSDNISLSASAGVSAIKNQDHYVIVPSKSLSGQTVELKVTGKDGKGNAKLLGTTKYKIRQLPAPTVYVNTTPNTSSSIRKTDLLSAVITASYGSSIPLSMSFKVKGFDLLTYYKGSPTYYTSTSNSMTTQQMNLIRALPVGSSITITNIKIQNARGNFVQSGSITFKIE